MLIRCLASLSDYVPWTVRDLNTPPQPMRLTSVVITFHRCGRNYFLFIKAVWKFTKLGSSLFGWRGLLGGQEKESDCSRSTKWCIGKSLSGIERSVWHWMKVPWGPDPYRESQRSNNQPCKFHVKLWQHEHIWIESLDSPEEQEWPFPETRDGLGRFSDVTILEKILFWL